MVGTRRNEGPSIAAEPPRMCYCGRPVYNDGACVCHSMDDDKDPTAFSLELARVREAGVRGRGYDFSQFVFPRSGWSLPDSYQGPANFFNATFLGDVDMSRTRFSEGADFSSAHFLGRTNFYACLFGAPTKFVKTRFDALVSFEEAKFQDDVAFLGSNFSLEVIFARVNFAGSATFDLAHFGGQSDFSFARFLGATSFEGTSYSARVTFLRAVFQRPLETTFSTTDLANVSLLECDVSQVRFFNVKWNREKKWYEASRDRVYDALHSRNYAGVAEVYRRLQANYLAAFRHAEAADFYVGEQEMIRRSRGRIGRYFSINSIYSFLSLYGESVRRPIVWLALVLLLFPILFLLVGIDVETGTRVTSGQLLQYHLTWQPGDLLFLTADYWQVFRSNLGWVSFYRSGLGAPCAGSWLQTLVVLETVLVITLITFVLLALRRRFRRKSF